jgi:branched-chain amino acid transport system ATP-binding protein
MIELREVTVTFGVVRAVDGVSARLTAAVTGIIGPNGAGKTTLLHALAGAVASGGSVHLDGVELTGLPAHRRARLGVRRTFQTSQVVPQLTVRDNVLVGADAGRRSSRRQQQQRVDELLSFVGLAGQGERRGVGLSNLDRRRVEIARSLVSEPSVVLMDEPGAGLSGDEKAELVRVIAGIADIHRAQVLLIEHDVELVARCCTEALVLDRGALVAAGSPAEVLDRPEVRAAYVGEPVESTPVAS